ncbi:MAG: polysaccharide biosynthesis protein [Acidimicrobiia bacterium]|nr:polysaccharide biosynthesis protein [Acidimicrobiia bacterium]
MTTQPTLTLAGPTGFYARFGKAVFDRVVGLVLAVMSLPVLMLLMIGIGLTLRKNPLVREPQVGLDGKPFLLLRLRTAAPERDHGYGRMLRRLSLDELPQLWNVVFGSMSLVGPRPLDADHVANLEAWMLRRHLVRPGITGLWQVDARGDGRDLVDNIHYDIQYIDQISLSTDLRILLKTLLVVFTRRERQPEDAARPPRRRLTSRFPHIRQVIVDQIIWSLALPLAALAHADFAGSDVNRMGLLVAIITAVGVQVFWGYGVGLYRGRWQLASNEAVGWLIVGTTLVSIALVAETLLPGDGPLKVGAIVSAAGFQLVSAIGVRYLANAVYAAQGRSNHTRPHRLLVFGAGAAGLKAAEAVWDDPASDSLPVAFLDADVAKHGTRPLGLSVVGGAESIGSAAYRYNADLLLIAMPSATGTAVRDIADIGHRAGLSVRILPRLSEYVLDDTDVVMADIREMTLADFLPREELSLDLESIAGYLTGKRVLVTGAGGSIGSVLCKIIERFDPKKLYKLDVDENALHGLQLALEGRALLDSDELLLCDIRDQPALLAAFEEAKPEVVFHAAARKHVTFLESHPGEAVKTNVLGTLNVLAAALAVGAERVVNVSTDKAADPINVLGLTKRMGEMLTAYYAGQGSTSFLSVRFGNVLGSNGSVIPTFREQILNREPITVTDPEVTRYFMTIEEACQLVVQAGALGNGGDVFVLEMGQPVRIVELAERLHQQLAPGRALDIVFTGLRPGEKLHEVLAGPDEELVDRPHDLLYRYAVPSLDPAVAQKLPANGSREFITTQLVETLADPPF